MAESLTPFVLWAQTEEFITLKVDLRDVTNPEITLTEHELEFKAIGYGAKGENEYEFHLDFYLPVDPQGSAHKVMEREVYFTIMKQGFGEWWPRLILQQKKPIWLKIDFDRWKSEDDEEDNINDPSEQYADELSEMKDEDDIPYKRKKGSPDFKITYLVLFSFFQLVGYMFILIVMLIMYSRDGADSLESMYDAVGKQMKFCQLIQVFEIAHTVFGFVDSSPLIPTIQVVSRNIVLFLMIDSEPRMQSKPFVFYMFLVWSFGEVIRYPYYMIRSMKKKWAFWTWLRYTVWIPLYPLAFLCEGVALLRAVPYFEETQKFSYSLPNHLNISIDFPSCIKTYLLLGYFPAMYILMKHMYRQRVKKVGPISKQRFKVN